MNLVGCMWKRYLLYAGIAVFIIIVIIAVFLLLNRQTTPRVVNQQMQTSPQAAVPSQEPITAQNGDQALQQTEANIQQQLDQATQDIQSIDQSNLNVSDENTANINNL